MRADELTKKQDEKFGHLGAGQLGRIEKAGTPVEPDFYKGNQLHTPQARPADPNHGRADIDRNVLDNSEQQGSFVKKISPLATTAPAAKQLTIGQRILSPFVNKKYRGKSSLLTVIVVLFGVGGFFTVLDVPASAILQLKEVFSQALNDQLKAVDSRSTKMIRAKFASESDSACTSKVCEKFGTMTEDEAKTFEARDKRFAIELTDVTDGSGKISKITFTDDGKSPVAVTDASTFNNLMDTNEAFHSGWTNVYNPMYESVSDPDAHKVIVDKDKASKNLEITGNDDKERQQKLNDIAVNGDEGSSAKNLTKTTDKDGNTIYTDDQGNTYTQAEYDAMSKGASDISAIEKAGGQNSIIDNSISRALTADQVGENVCTTYNFMRRVSALAKDVKKLQAIRYALALVLTMADKIKAGDATEGEVNFAGNNIMTPQPEKQVIDDTKLTSTIGSIPMSNNSEAGGTGLDAPSYKMTAYKDPVTLSSRASKFSLTGGSTTVIDTITTDVAKIVNGGNPDPKLVSQKCGYLQSTFVRVGALGLGIIAGAATFGTWQVAGFVASAAWSIAQPSIEAAAGDMIAGNVFKDISGMDSVDATYVGTASLFGDIAQSRGMLPVTGQDGEDYINSNQQSTQAYVQDQQYLARGTPFDLSNRYSFLGSILFSFTPQILQARSSASVAMLNIAGLIPTVFTNVIQPTTKAAATSNYFDSCPDQTYKADGIKAGPFCEVRYWMPQNSLDVDPLQNAQWMVNAGYIDGDTGEAKDTNQDWNYTKYLAQCANRTVGWGENEDENEGDGTDCYSPDHESVNMHFRAYTMDNSINTGMGSSV